MPALYVFPLHLDYQRFLLKRYKQFYSGIYKLECTIAFFLMYQIDLEIVFPVGDAIDNVEPLIVFGWEAGSPA